MRNAWTVSLGLVCLVLAVDAVPRRQQQRQPVQPGAPQTRQQPARGRPQNTELPNARDVIEGRILSSTMNGTVIRADTGEPLAGVRIRPKPLELPNAFDKPCKERTKTDISEGDSVMTNERGEFIVDVPSRLAPVRPRAPTGAPAPPAGALDETVQRILEMERLRQLAQGGVSAVDQEQVDRTRIPRETIEAMVSQGTIPLATRDRVHSELIAEREGFVQAPWDDLTLLPAPTLSGRVFDADNKPLAGAMVQVYDVRVRPFGRTMKWVKSALTNDLGEYRLPWLPYGWYVIAAGNSAFLQQPWKGSLKLSPNLPEPDYGLPMMFYPGVENAPDAQLIHIKLPAAGDAGMPAPIANIALKERPRSNLKVGLVAETMPVNPNLVVVPAGGDVCATMDYAIKSNGDGTFDVRNIPRGRYEIVATQGRDVITALLSVNVEKDMDDIKLAVMPPTTVQGTVTFEDLPLGIDVNRLLGEIRVSLTRARSEVSQVAVSVADPRTFNFSISGVGPGFYYPTVLLPPGAFVKVVQVAALERDRRAAEDEWKCTALPYGPYPYLDGHGHLEPLEIPRDLASLDPKIQPCLKIEISFSGHLKGPAVPPLLEPKSPILAVLLPRSVWANDHNGVTPPDRILVGDASFGFWEFFGVPKGDYRLYALTYPNAELIYRRELSEWFGAYALALLFDTVPPCIGSERGGIADSCTVKAPPQTVVDRVVP